MRPIGGSGATAFRWLNFREAMIMVHALSRKKAAEIASGDLLNSWLLETEVLRYSYRRITSGSTFIALRAGT